ncbi:hypothetical protein IDJ77_13170 [Mucilaginibacter sp. ZT4R22]|uniref:Uncharacterized protein n=1 Tax=Mucilaginibacter pankratovii TaxID=2772110 RepID=A0ABR7WR28_9SPHI|nr:hypothetical protein [Mucilaginibacter pankratovii]MBD1364765.1 hypothetical protein [Mucilaginibacter pankratovii]
MQVTAITHGLQNIKRVLVSIGKSIVLTAKSRAMALPDISIAICTPFIFLLYANVLQRIEAGYYL